MHKCDEHDADLVIDGTPYKLDTLAECKRMGRLRGTAVVVFHDYTNTLIRLEYEHREALIRQRAQAKDGRRA
jgi:hypothetical protein